MNRENLSRNLLLCALLSALALGGCGKKTETHDPDLPPATSELPADDSSATSDSTDDMSTTDMDSSSTGDDSSSSTDTDTSAADESIGREDVVVCTDTWFEQVNQQVMVLHSEAIAEQFPEGFPEVGSDEWFMAVDKLTGGDGAHGPDGGSDEWCAMIQKRLPPEDGTTDDSTTDDTDSQ